jgi:hypothetical protein
VMPTRAQQLGLIVTVTLLIAYVLIRLMPS